MPVFYCVTFPCEDGEGGVEREWFTSLTKARSFAYFSAKEAKRACREDMIHLDRHVYKNIINALNRKSSEYDSILAYYVERKDSAGGKYQDELEPKDFTIVLYEKGGV